MTRQVNQADKQCDCTCSILHCPDLDRPSDTANADVAAGAEGVQAAGAGADSSHLAASGSEQKTPSRLHIAYLQCEADDKLNQLVRTVLSASWVHVHIGEKRAF
jgi:hypothetical protein